VATNEGRSGTKDDEGAMLPTMAFALPTTDEPAMGTETKVLVIIEEELELQTSFDKTMSSALGAPRCFHIAARMKGIIPSSLQPSKLRGGVKALSHAGLNHGMKCLKPSEVNAHLVVLDEGLISV